jgi:ribosomal protein S18 acetylase RimI-like enzyme
MLLVNQLSSWGKLHLQFEHEMSAVLRKASPTDAKRIAALGATAWTGTYITGEIPPDIARYLSTEFSPQRIAAQIADASRHWTVAEFDGQIVGYAHLKHGEGCPNSVRHSAELVNLYIREAFTRRGIGTRLLQESERVAAAKAERLWLSVNARNARALGFYRDRGYRNVGELYFELGNQKYKNDVLVN